MPQRLLHHGGISRLDKLTEATHRARPFLAGEAIRQYLDSEAWQVGEIQLAIKEADAGDFAPDDEVNAILRSAQPLIPFAFPFLPFAF